MLKPQDHLKGNRSSHQSLTAWVATQPAMGREVTLPHELGQAVLQNPAPIQRTPLCAGMPCLHRSSLQRLGHRAGAASCKGKGLAPRLMSAEGLSGLFKAWELGGPFPAGLANLPNTAASCSGYTLELVMVTPPG